MSKKIGDYVYDENRELGKGSFGAVYLGIHKATLKQVAVKVISLARFPQTRKRLQENFRNEATNMQLGEGDNIVSLLSIKVTENNLYLICEYCQGGNLQNYIDRHRFLPEKQALKLIKDIVSGFKCLHENNIVHRDLKPANILLQNGVAKVGDFGFSKLTEAHNLPLVSLVGTPQYMSPQILREEAYTEKTDIWSLGLILFLMLFGRLPWDNTYDPKLLLKRIENQKISIPSRPKVSKQTLQLMQRMLQIEQKDRIGWQELFEYDFTYRDGKASSIQNSQKTESSKSTQIPEAKSMSYAKAYFDFNKVILNIQQLRAKSISSNDFINKFILSVSNSTEMEVQRKHVENINGNSLWEATNRLLAIRNEAILFISMYFKVAALNSKAVKNSVSLGLQLLLLKQAFITLYGIYKSFKHNEVLAGFVGWQELASSENGSQLKALSKYDNTMCSLIYNMFLSKCKLEINQLTLSEDEDADSIGELLPLVNQEYDTSGRVRHLLKKYMWTYLLQASQEDIEKMDTLQVCALLGEFLRSLTDEKYSIQYNKHLMNLYQQVEVRGKESMKLVVAEAVNYLS